MAKFEGRIDSILKSAKILDMWGGRRRAHQKFGEPVGEASGLLGDVGGRVGLIQRLEKGGVVTEREVTGDDWAMAKRFADSKVVVGGEKELFTYRRLTPAPFSVSFARYSGRLREVRFDVWDLFDRASDARVLNEDNLVQLTRLKERGQDFEVKAKFSSELTNDLPTEELTVSWLKFFAVSRVGVGETTCEKILASPVGSVNSEPDLVWSGTFRFFISQLEIKATGDEMTILVRRFGREPYLIYRINRQLIPVHDYDRIGLERALTDEELTDLRAKIFIAE